MVWFNFFPSELHEGRGAGDSADRGLPSRPAALTGRSRLWVTLGASLQHQAVLQEEPVHLRPLRVCVLILCSCVKCLLRAVIFTPFPGREVAALLHPGFTTSREWERGVSHSLCETPGCFCPPFQAKEGVCALHSPVPKPLVTSQSPSHQTEHF